jgi:hypothetical protein
MVVSVGQAVRRESPLVAHRPRQVASPHATPAAFDDQEVVVEGRRYRLGRTGDELRVYRDALPAA